MEEYKEKEIKILDVDVDILKGKLEEIGAKKVYDDVRTITTFDTEEGEYLLKEDKLIRITEEETVKVTMHVNNSKKEEKRVIKYKVSRTKEQEDFLKQLGLVPISRVKARRVSYELSGIDFDIDVFPKIPPFLEIDVETLDEKDIKSLLDSLELSNKKLVIMGTEDIHKLYEIDYFKEYSV